MTDDNKILVIIPARGGSKGIPHKNIKPLNGKPLIEYAIDGARSITSDANICVSTDDNAIIEIVESYGLTVPFKRPDYLATDMCGTYDVLLHAISYYEQLCHNYETVVLLQPTSPFRSPQNIKEALSIYSNDIDMVVSVCDATHSYYEEDANGFLKNIRGNTNVVRRQDMSKIWQYNGAIYVININSLKSCPMSMFTKVRKYVMDDIQSLDLDTMCDWKIAEAILKEN